MKLSREKEGERGKNRGDHSNKTLQCIFKLQNKKVNGILRELRQQKIHALIHSK